MFFLEVALGDLIRTRKTQYGEFDYVYVPTNGAYTGKKNVFDVLKADIETYTKFVASHKPEGQPAEDFDKNILSAIKGVSYEAVEIAVGDEEKEKKLTKGNYLSGPLNPGKLRHEFSLTARSVKPKDCGKLLAFVKALPGVVDAEILHHNHKISWTTITLKLDDAEKIKELTHARLKNNYSRSTYFENHNSDHQNLIKKPFSQMGALMRRRLGFSRFYLKAFQDDKDSTVHREVVIFDQLKEFKWTELKNKQTPEYCGKILTKWKKALEEWDIKDVENMKVLVCNNHVVEHIIVRFKTKEAAESFVTQSTNLMMDDCKVLSDMVTSLPEILSLEQPNDAGVLNRFLTGVEDEAVLEEDKALVVCLFDEGVKDLSTIKQFFSNEKPEKMVNLSFKQSSLLGPHLFHPKLLVTFKTQEELDQTLLNLDTVNNNRTFNEWVYAVSLKTMLHQKRSFCQSSKLTQTSEECRRMFDIDGDIMRLKYVKDKKSKLQEKKSQAKTKSVEMNEAKADMNVSMGDWVTNSLPPNQSQVKWHSSEAPEIGKYFFDNHLNVAEIKIPAGLSIVYSRFNTCEDAVEFAGLPYALYKGVKINRRRYVDTPEFKDARLRVFLTGTKQENISVGLNTPSKSTNQNGNARSSEGRLILSLGIFHKKLTNQELFDKLKREIGLEKSEIKQGDWRKISDTYYGLRWKAEVNMLCDLKKSTQLVLSWNQKEVNVDGHLIQAELVKVAPGKKRKNTDSKNNGVSKKAKESICEN